MVLLYGETTVPKRWLVRATPAAVFLRVYLPIAGGALYRSETQEKRLQAGRLYCLPTNCAYQITQLPDTPFEVFYLHAEIAPFTLSTLVELPVLPDTLLGQMLQTFRVYCAHYPDNLASALSQSIFLPMVDYLKAEGVLTLSDTWLEQSVQYIIAHLDTPLSIDALSAMAGYHPQYYIRAFTKAQGVTPHQFIIACRMKRSLHYLSTGHTVAQSAAMVGFGEAKNFSRAFRQYFGVNPSAVKKHLQSHP